MKAVRDELNSNVFAPEGQRCICVIPVADLSKKKRDDRMIYLAVAVDHEGSPFLCLLRKSDKTQMFKKKHVERMKDIKYIDARDSEPLRIDVCTQSDRFLSYECDDPIDKNSMLVALYKVCNHYFKSAEEKPEIINFKVPDELAILKDVQTAQDNSLNSAEYAKFQAITSEEEKMLYSLMDEWHLSVRDAESLMEKSMQKLAELDIANVGTIINAEEDSLTMMNKLDKVIDDVSELEDKIQSFVNRLDVVSDAVKIMSEKDLLIQIEHNNRRKLERLLEIIVNKMDLNAEEMSLLKTEELAIPVAQPLIDAANTALSAAQFQLPVRLEHSIDGLTSRRAEIAKVCNDFAKRVYNCLSDRIVKLADTESNRFDPDDVDLPLHSEFFNGLMPYAPLVDYVRRCDPALFSQLTKVMKVSMAPIYNREVCGFIENARSAVAQKLGLVQDKGSVVSLDTLFAKSDKMQLTGSFHGTDILDTHQSLRTSRQRASKIVEKVLTQLESLFYAQQEFFTNFYGISEREKKKTDNIALAKEMEEIEPTLNVPSTEGEGERSQASLSLRSALSSGTQEALTSNGVSIWSLMSEIFDGIESEVQSLISYINKQDQLNCLYIFVKISEQTNLIQKKGLFIQKFFAALLITVKRSLDSYTRAVSEAILYYRISRTKRVGILPYVDFFQDFASEAEDVFENSSRRVDLDRIYKAILDAIFQGIETATSESARVPPDLIRIENYHKLHHIIRSCKVASLEQEKSRAEDCYKRCMRAFVAALTIQPFEDMNKFFATIQQRLAAGVPPEDIQYHSELSVVELKRIIRDHPWPEVRKRLDLLYRKIQKFVTDDSSLCQVIWREVQSLFLGQCRRFTELIAMCYPSSNVSIGFTEQDVSRYFSGVTDEAGTF